MVKANPLAVGNFLLRTLLVCLFYNIDHTSFERGEVDNYERWGIKGNSNDDIYNPHSDHGMQRAGSRQECYTSKLVRLFLKKRLVHSKSRSSRGKKGCNTSVVYLFEGRPREKKKAA